MSEQLDDDVRKWLEAFNLAIHSNDASRLPLRMPIAVRALLETLLSTDENLKRISIFLEQTATDVRASHEREEQRRVENNKRVSYFGIDPAVTEGVT